MSKLSEEKNRIVFLIIMIILGSVFTLIHLSINGNADQVFNDIIVEYTSIFQSNKSAERTLLFGLIFAGIIIYAIFYIASKYIWKDNEEVVFTSVNTSEQKSKEFVCALIAMAATFLLIFGNLYPLIIASLLYAMILFVIDRELICAGICTFYMSAYTFIGLFRLYVYCGGENPANTMIISVFAFLVAMIPLAFQDKNKALIRETMIEGLIVPFSLFIYLSKKYKNGEEIVAIDVPNAVKYAVWTITILFLAEAIWKIVKKWNVAEKIDEAINIGSCVAIMAFNRFDGTGAIMPTDIRHASENIIGFSQIFDLGQTPFQNYIPVSGMYSIVQGAIFDWFGDGGLLSNYYVTNNLFYLFVIILIVVLLKMQLDGVYVFLIALAFYVKTYNRSVFMLPIMLLLIWPKLIENKNAWIVTWFLTSLFQGLYYPLYGAATCVAFFPLLVWQVITLIQSGELKKDIKTAKFWIPWAICIVLLLCSARSLLGELRHMLAMSGQSVLADGLSRFGQLVPGWFFSYLGNDYSAIRIGLYYIISVMIPVIFVWIAFAFATKMSLISFRGKRLHIGDIKTACICLSTVIMPIICYTFTFTRLDIDTIYARSAGVLFAGMVLMLIFALRFADSEKLKQIMVIAMISILAIVNCESVFAIESNSKLSTYYTVPEDYIYVKDDVVEKIGSGFISQPIYDSIESTYVRFENKDKDASYMGDPANFGYFYLLGIKGDGAMEIATTVKSYSVAEEAVEMARANSSIIGPSFCPFYNYYFYHWLLASGEYYWDADAWEFIPNNGVYTREEIINQNKNNGIAWNDMDLGKTASSWGSSMESLEELFSEPGIGYTARTEGNGIVVDFLNPMDGDDADFLYVEFEGMKSNYEYTLYNSSVEVTQPESQLGKYLMKKNYNPNMIVQIRWQDDYGETHTMNCNMSKGKLLIPLGAGSKWLFNQHSNISIHVYQDGNEVICPAMTNIRMLKIREIV